jgi:hypothetical protein
MPAAFFQHIYFKKRRLVRAAQHDYHIISMQGKSMIIRSQKEDSPYCTILGFYAGLWGAKSCGISHLAKRASIRYYKSTKGVRPMV